MGFFSRMSPVRAYQDLRFFLAQRQPYELGFLALAIVITGFFVYAFALNDYAPPPYRPNIVYVEQWPLTRTDAEIRAAQQVDKVVKTKRLAEEKAATDARKAQFKQMDDAMSKWGL